MPPALPFIFFNFIYPPYLNNNTNIGNQEIDHITKTNCSINNPRLLQCKIIKPNITAETIQQVVIK